MNEWTKQSQNKINNLRNSLQIIPAFQNNPKFQKAYETLPMKIAIFLIFKTYAFIIAGYCLIPFAYLSFYKWWAIYKSFYFIGHIVIIPMSFVWKPLILAGLKICFPLDKKPADASIDEKTALNTQHEKSN